MAFCDKDGVVVSGTISKGKGSYGTKTFDDDGNLIEADAFMFYKTWLQMADVISDEHVRHCLIEAIVRYGIYGAEPPESSPEIVKVVFTQIKFHIDSQIAHFLNGSSGGRPPKDAADDSADLEPLIQELPDSVQNTARNFVQHRSDKGTPLNKTSFEALLKELNEYSDGDSVIACKILNKSISSGWNGIFPLDKEKPKRKARERNEVWAMLEKEAENEQN